MITSRPATAPELRPKPGVLFAAVDGEGVLMDLAENRYIGLSAASAELWQRAWGDHVGTPSERGVSCSAGSPFDDPRWLRQLEIWRRDRLLLPAEQAARWSAEAPSADTRGGIARSELDPSRLDATRLTTGALWNAVVAWRWSRRALKLRGLPWALRQLERVPATPTDEVPQQVFPTLVAARAFRRLFSQGAEDCLPRSLALVWALRRLGADARLCFGVRKLPFAAHAWAENAGCLLNETRAALDGYVLLGRFGQR